VNNRYAQVALTYLRRPFSSIGVFIRSVVLLGMAALFIWISTLPGPGEKAGQMFFFGFMLAGVFVYATLAVHIRQQFDDPRAHLFPNFRRAHLIIACLMLVVSTIVLLAVLNFRAGQISIGTAAVLVCWFSLIFWNVLVLPLIFITIGVFIAGIFDGDRVMLFFANYEPVAAGLLILGLATIALGARRLVRLSANPPEYHRIQTDRTGQLQISEVNRPTAKWTERLVDRNAAVLIQSAQRAAVSSWARIRRWQVGKPAGWMMLIYAFSLFLLFVVINYLTLNSSGAGRISPRIMPMISTILFTLPALASGNLPYRRYHTLGFVFLLPVERKSFLKQQGLAIAGNQFQTWGIVGLTAFVWQQIAEPQFTPLLLALLAHSFMWQIGVFGVGIWFLRFRSPGWTIMSVIIILNISISFFNQTIRDHPSALWQSAFWFGSVGVALFGLLLTWHAYRRWLVAEMN
jgi:hypothetical protein